jgi:cytochrome bd-type quinol oxidase subunit 1
VKIIFRVGLVLLKCMLGSPEKLKKSQGLYETMELLKALPPAYMEEGFLVREVGRRGWSSTLDTHTLSTNPTI